MKWIHHPLWWRKEGNRVAGWWMGQFASCKDCEFYIFGEIVSFFIPLHRVHDFPYLSGWYFKNKLLKYHAGLSLQELWFQFTVMHCFVTLTTWKLAFESLVVEDLLIQVWDGCCTQVLKRSDNRGNSNRYGRNTEDARVSVLTEERDTYQRLVFIFTKLWCTSPKSACRNSNLIHSVAKKYIHEQFNLKTTTNERIEYFASTSASTYSFSWTQSLTIFQIQESDIHRVVFVLDWMFNKTMSKHDR